MAKGMNSIAMHRSKLPKGRLRAALAEARAGTADAERVALRMLESAMQVIGPTEFKSADKLGSPEYKGLGIDKVPFSDNRIVKFRQHFNKIPVYGSIVSVELDSSNELVSLDSSIGAPTGVDAVATISPAQALAAVAKTAGYAGSPPDEQPRLNFFFDRRADRWRLAYIVEDVLRRKSRPRGKGHGRTDTPEYSDFVVDAHSGELVAELPRTALAERTGKATGRDLLGDKREFRVRFKAGAGQRWMYDAERNIHTHDFGFKDISRDKDKLPGPYAEIPPKPWSAAAVSCHANTRIVADWLFEVLERDGIDGEGGKIVSSVNCIKRGEDTVGQEWRNAMRLPRQMAYGQREVDGELRSYAASLEIVAHELLHGVTDRTARLEYRFQSGALNESYSDIFGVIIANRAEPDIGRWEWRIGDEMRDMTDGEDSIRNMADPSACGHPEHMDDYLDLSEDEDDGGLHKNNGIHNKAAHNIFTAKKPGGGFLFTAEEVARLFYVTLVSRLSRTSEFADSRRGVLLTAQSMFADDPLKTKKLAAIGKAFDKVGIVEAAS